MWLSEPISYMHARTVCDISLLHFIGNDCFMRLNRHCAIWAWLKGTPKANSFKALNADCHVKSTVHSHNLSVNTSKCERHGIFYVLLFAVSLQDLKYTGVPNHTRPMMIICENGKLCHVLWKDNLMWMRYIVFKREGAKGERVPPPPLPLLRHTIITTYSHRSSHDKQVGGKPHLPPLPPTR